MTEPTTPQTALRIAGTPTMTDLEWLCRNPRHSMIMVEIEEVFVPMIVDEQGRGPVCPPREIAAAALEKTT